MTEHNDIRKDFLSKKSLSEQESIRAGRYSAQTADGKPLSISNMGEARYVAESGGTGAIYVHNINGDLMRVPLSDAAAAGDDFWRTHTFAGGKGSAEAHMRGVEADISGAVSPLEHFSNIASGSLNPFAERTEKEKYVTATQSDENPISTVFGAAAPATVLGLATSGLATVAGASKLGAIAAEATVGGLFMEQRLSGAHDRPFSVDAAGTDILLGGGLAAGGMALSALRQARKAKKAAAIAASEAASQAPVPAAGAIGEALPEAVSAALPKKVRKANEAVTAAEAASNRSAKTAADLMEESAAATKAAEGSRKAAAEYSTRAANGHIDSIDFREVYKTNRAPERYDPDSEYLLANEKRSTGFSVEKKAFYGTVKDDVETILGTKAEYNAAQKRHIVDNLEPERVRNDKIKAQLDAHNLSVDAQNAQLKASYKESVAAYKAELSEFNKAAKAKAKVKSGKKGAKVKPGKKGAEVKPAAGAPKPPTPPDLIPYKAGVPDPNFPRAKEVSGALTMLAKKARSVANQEATGNLGEKLSISLDRIAKKILGGEIGQENALEAINQGSQTLFEALAKKLNGTELGVIREEIRQLKRSEALFGQSGRAMAVFDDATRKITSLADSIAPRLKDGGALAHAAADGSLVDVAEVLGKIDEQIAEVRAVGLDSEAFDSFASSSNNLKKRLAEGLSFENGRPGTLAFADMAGRVSTQSAKSSEAARRLTDKMARNALKKAQADAEKLEKVRDAAVTAHERAAAKAIADQSRAAKESARVAERAAKDADRAYRRSRGEIEKTRRTIAQHVGNISAAIGNAAGFSAFGVPGALFGGRSAGAAGRKAANAFTGRAADPIQASAVATRKTIVRESAASAGALQSPALGKAARITLHTASRVFMRPEEKRRQYAEIASAVMTAVNNPDNFVQDVEITSNAFAGSDAMGEMGAQHVKTVYHLYKKLPSQDPTTLSNTEIDAFMAHVDMATDPLLAMNHLAAGTFTAGMRETLMEVYPAVYGEMIANVIGEVGPTDKLPYVSQIFLSQFIGAPVDKLMQPNHIMTAQKRFAQTTEQDAVLNGPSGPQKTIDSESIAGGFTRRQRMGQ